MPTVYNVLNMNVVKDKEKYVVQTHATSDNNLCQMVLVKIVIFINDQALTVKIVFLIHVQNFRNFKLMVHAPTVIHLLDSQVMVSLAVLIFVIIDKNF